MMPEIMDGYIACFFREGLHGFGFQVRALVL